MTDAPAPPFGSLSPEDCERAYWQALVLVETDRRARNSRLKALNPLIDPPLWFAPAEEVQAFLAQWERTPEASDVLMAYVMNQMRQELARREREGYRPP
jgi:hypothetical protein